MIRRREQGSALVVTLGVIVCLTGLGLGMLTTAMTERTIAARMRAASASAGCPSTASSSRTTSVSTPTTGRSERTAATDRALPSARATTTSAAVPGIGASS